MTERPQKLYQLSLKTTQNSNSAQLEPNIQLQTSILKEVWQKMTAKNEFPAQVKPHNNHTPRRANNISHFKVYNLDLLDQVPERILFKTAVLTQRSLYGNVPSYLSSYFKRVTNVPSWQRYAQVWSASSKSKRLTVQTFRLITVLFRQSDIYFSHLTFLYLLLWSEK